MTMTANDRMELWTVVVQAIVLSIGFALVFSWNEDSIPKALAAINIVLLVLIYAMPDRLRNALQKEIKELHKAHGVTQVMIMELRESIPDKTDLERLSFEDKLAKVQDIAKKLDTVRSGFNKSFEEGFQYERSIGGADQIQFFADTLGTTVYLSALIGGSAFIGWLISFLV
jgi:hypothetical protein